MFGEPTDWDGDVAAAKLQTRLAQHPDINGIYMQAGGVFLAPDPAGAQAEGPARAAGRPEARLRRLQRRHPAGVRGHPQGRDRRHRLPAGRPYAKYALYYAKAAAEGKTFKPGPTDHDCTIIKRPERLEDQLPAPLVTKDNVDDQTLWGNQIGK